MKIKYFDKKHKKLSDSSMSLIDKVALFGGISLTGAIILSFAITAPHELKKSNIRHEINNVPYVIEENNTTYSVGDIWLLYNDNEIIKCGREQIEIGTDSDFNMSLSISSGTPMLSSSKDYVYKFYDLKTNELIGYTTFDVYSDEYLAWPESEEKATENLNGYKFINLGKILGYKELDEYQNMNQEYVDEFIEERRFLNK